MDNASDCPNRRFNPGTAVATSMVHAAIPVEVVHAFLDRHIIGDWGDLPQSDRDANERALADGGRIVSRYVVSRDFSAASVDAGWGRIEPCAIYIITEADRSATTVMFAQEY